MAIDGGVHAAAVTISAADPGQAVSSSNETFKDQVLMPEVTHTPVIQVVSDCGAAPALADSRRLVRASRTSRCSSLPLTSVVRRAARPRAVRLRPRPRVRRAPTTHHSYTFVSVPRRTSVMTSGCSVLARLRTSLRDPAMRVRVLALVGGKMIGLALVVCPR